MPKLNESIYLAKIKAFFKGQTIYISENLLVKKGVESIAPDSGVSLRSVPETTSLRNRIGKFCI